MRNSAENNYTLKTLKRLAFAIATVVFVEVVLGLVVGSLAILSDGLHALLDALTTFGLLIATRASLEPPDEEHMYGHEKFESIGGLIGGMALIGVAIVIMIEAVLKILESKPYLNLGLEYVGLIAIGYTFCIDFFRVGIFLRSRKSESSTMKAGFYHALADLSSTVIALLGFGLAALGFYYGDSLASMILSMMLTYLSVKLVWSNVMELSDTISRDIAERIRKEIVGTKGVCTCKDLKIRKAGDKSFVRVTVQVPDYLDLGAAHDLTSRIEARVKQALGNAEVIIHTEPFETEMCTDKMIEKLALETEGVRGVHEIDTAYAEGRLYVTLHVYVDAKLSVEEADRIAQKIEDKVDERVSDVENVTVHVEPHSTKKRKGPAVKEDEISRVIQEATQASQAFRVKRIVTYVADNKRYINIDCRFTNQISVEDAHRIASEIEEKVKTHYAETVVTVHME